MKKVYFTALTIASMILSGCASDSSSSTRDDSNDNAATSTTITVERGPILKATVVDTNGQRAEESGAGEYTFASLPVYPIIAVGGVIDIDRDGVVSIGDVVNDLNFTTTAGSVITIATTLASNPATKAELERIASDLNLSVADIIGKTPSDSKEIEAISNIAYRYIKDNNITDLTDSTDQKLIELNITREVHAEYQVYIEDETHDFQENEKVLMDSLVVNNPSSVDYLDNDAEVSSELEDIAREEESIDLNDIKNHLTTLKHEYEVEYGDLDYEDDGDDIFHSQGVSCASCHGIAGATNLAVAKSEEDNDDEDGEENEDGENIFTSGATIFTSLNAVNSDASKAASNYSLRLVLESGAVTSYRIGRGTGNVNATFNAGITKYTTEVLDARGSVVNRSNLNSHDSSRFDCNRCHTSEGVDGAPGRVVSFSYTTPVVPTDTNSTDTNTTVAKSFVNDILPILNTNCKSCHGSSGNFSITTSATEYVGVTPFVNTADAQASKLLEKASGTVFHGGNRVLSTTSTEYITIREWISEGALDN